MSLTITVRSADAGSKNPAMSNQIEDILKACSKASSSGQLLHVRRFDTFRAMSALVMFDPKQDSGLVLKGNLSEARKLTVAHAPLNLRDHEAAYVFDALMACEATWHQGQALASTVYTCLYMHDGTRIQLASAPVLDAYFNAVYILVTSLQSVVSEAGVGDEEDFYLPDLGQVRHRLTEHEDETEKNTIERLKFAERWLQVNGDKAHLLARIRFRRFFQTAVAYLSRKPTADGAEQARRNLDMAANLLEEIRTSATLYSQMTICNQRNSGLDHLDWEPVGLGFNSKIHATHAGPPQTACLLSRKSGFDHFSKLIVDMRRVCDIILSCARQDGLQNILYLLNWISNANSGIIPRSFAALVVCRDDSFLAHICEAVLPSKWICKTFTTLYQPSSCCCRNGLQLEHNFRYLNAACQPKYSSGAIDNGSKGDILWGNHKGFDRSNHILSGNNIIGFRTVITRAVNVLIQAHFSNRCRLRRRLRHLLKEWTFHHSNAVRMDTSASLYPDVLVGSLCPQALVPPKSTACACSSWTHSVLIHIQMSHLILGFDLDLYLPYELTMIYWYQDYLLTMRAGIQTAVQRTVLTMIKENAASEHAAREFPTAHSDACAENNADRAEQNVSEITTSAGVWVESGFIILQSMICQGLLRMLVALDASGRIDKPRPNNFTDEEQHFWLRFGSFHCCSKPIPMGWIPFSDYVVRNANQPIAKLLDSASDCFSQARHKSKELIFGRKDTITPAESAELRILDRIAAANLMAIRLINTSGITVDFDHKMHDIFVTVIVNKKANLTIS